MSLKLSKYLLNTIYDESDFTVDQIQEMELGLENNDSIDYCNPNISVEEMKKIRTANKIKIKF